MIVALAIIARFVYRVSRIEAGWSTVAARWHAATFGRLTSSSTVPLLEPPKQADYWLAEVDRVVSGPGEAGLPATAEFLKHSRLTRGEQVDVATASLILRRSSEMAIDLFRWQTERANDCDEKGDSAQALTLSRQCIHALSQIEATGETLVYDQAFAFIRRQALLRNLALSQANPHLVNPAEKQKLAEQLRGAVLKYKLVVDARNRANPKRTPPNVDDIAIHAVFASTPASVSLLLIGGLAAWLAGKWLGRGAGWQKPLPVWQHVIVWLAAYGIVFAVAGMAPAELIPANVQPWLAIGSIAAGLLFAGFLLWRARFRFTLRAVFIMTFVCAALCVPLAALHQEGALDDFPTSLRMLPQGAGVWDAAALNTMLRIQPHSWLSAAYQWLLRSGCFYSAVTSPLFVALWWSIRRASKKDGEAQNSARMWWASLLRDGGRSALVLAVVLLLVDLVLLPRVLEDAEATYQKRMLFFHDPAASYVVSRAALSAVEQDQTTMDALRQATEEEPENVLGSDAHPADGGP